MCNWCEVITRRYAAAGRVLAWNEQIVSSSERHPLCAQSSTPTLWSSIGDERVTKPFDELMMCWSAGHSQRHAAWTLLAMTGMRRGEALALRWRDVDLDAATVSVRRSAGLSGSRVRVRASPRAARRSARTPCR